MNDLERLTDIQFQIKLVKEHIEWQNNIDTVFYEAYKLEKTDKVIKLKIQIKDLENRRKRIIRRMYNKYCK